jgi:hypothetical protein
MDWRERRNLQAEFANSQYERQRQRQETWQHGNESGGCLGCLSLIGAGIVLILIASIIITFVVRRASDGGSSQESVHLGTYTQVFASPLPADPARAQVIEGFRKAQILWVKSDIALHLVAPVTDYITGNALTDLTAAISAGRTRNRVPAGVDRFFMTHVEAITESHATITTCDDGSKFIEKNPRTGQIDAAYAPKAGQAYAFETWQMVQRSGHWAIADFSAATLPNPSAAACQPGV